MHGLDTPPCPGRSRCSHHAVGPRGNSPSGWSAIHGRFVIVSVAYPKP
jgi:hypothetical protein